MQRGLKQPVKLFVALLRGVNVGGKNMIRMSSLKESFERMGFGDVATYINSEILSSKLRRATRESWREASRGCCRVNTNSNAKSSSEVFPKWPTSSRACPKLGTATGAGSTTSSSSDIRLTPKTSWTV